MNTNHLVIFCAVLGGWLLLSRKIRKDVSEFGDDWLGTVKYYGIMLLIFTFFLGGGAFFLNDSATGNGQISAFTDQRSSKNYRLNAQITLNPNKDPLHFFKKDQYKITSVTWPDGEQDNTDCTVIADNRNECQIGDQTYYVEVAWFQSNDSGSND